MAAFGLWIVSEFGVKYSKNFTWNGVTLSVWNSWNSGVKLHPIIGVKLSKDLGVKQTIEIWV